MLRDARRCCGGSTGRDSTGKAGTAKDSTTKDSTVKASTVKASTVKDGTVNFGTILSTGRGSALGLLSNFRSGNESKGR